MEKNYWIRLSLASTKFIPHFSRGQFSGGESYNFDLIVTFIKNCFVTVKIRKGVFQCYCAFETKMCEVVTYYIFLVSISWLKYDYKINFYG